MKINMLTNAGKAYLNDAITNSTNLELVEMAIGDGTVQTELEASAFTDLKSRKKTFNILDITEIDGVNSLRVDITNMEITEGFRIRELGVYGRKPDGSKVLFWYINYDEESSWIQSISEGLVRSPLVIKLVISADNIAVNTIVDPNIMITPEYINNSILILKNNVAIVTDDLDERLTTVADALNMLGVTVGDNQTSITNLNKTTADANIAAASLKTKVDTMKDTADTLATKVTGMKTDADALTERVTNAETAASTLSNSVVTMKATADTLATKVSGMKDTANTLATKVTGMKDTADTLATKVTGMKTDADALAETVGNINTTVTSQGETLVSTTKTATETADKVATAETDISNLKTKTSTNTENIGNLTVSVSSLTERLAEGPMLWKGWIPAAESTMVTATDLPSSSASYYRLVIGGVIQIPEDDYTVDSTTNTVTIIDKDVDIDLPYLLVEA